MVCLHGHFHSFLSLFCFGSRNFSSSEEVSVSRFSLIRLQGHFQSFVLGFFGWESIEEMSFSLFWNRLHGHLHSFLVFAFLGLSSSSDESLKNKIKSI